MLELCLLSVVHFVAVQAKYLLHNSESMIAACTEIVEPLTLPYPTPPLPSLQQARSGTRCSTRRWGGDHAVSSAGEDPKGAHPPVTAPRRTGRPTDASTGPAAGEPRQQLPLSGRICPTLCWFHPAPAASQHKQARSQQHSHRYSHSCSQRCSNRRSPPVFILHKECGKRKRSCSPSIFLLHKVRGYQQTNHKCSPAVPCPQAKSRCFPVCNLRCE